MRGQLSRTLFIEEAFAFRHLVKTGDVGKLWTGAVDYVARKDRAARYFFIRSAALK